MTQFERTTLIVLAGGLSTRFGNDKLSFLVDGRPLATHLLFAVDGLNFSARLLVARNQGWTVAFEAAGFRVIQNTEPERGLSASLRLALEQSRTEHLLILLGDMPRVTQRHLLELAGAYERVGHQPVASSSPNGYRGPPALLPRQALQETALHGDSGARKLISHALLVEAPAAELRDIDTRADL